MKATNRSWRVQKGSAVHFAMDRRSGEGEVVKVVSPPKLGIGDGKGVYLVRDNEGAEHTVTGGQIRFPKL